METTGERISWARAQRGLSQAALAKMAGVSQGTIGNIEAGIRRNPRALLSIATALGASPHWIDSGEGPWQHPSTAHTGVVYPSDDLRANLNSLVKLSGIDDADALFAATGIPAQELFAVLRGDRPADEATVLALARATDCDPLNLYAPAGQFLAMLRRQGATRFRSERPGMRGNDQEFGNAAGALDINVGIPVTGEAVMSNDELHIELIKEGGTVIGTAPANAYALKVRGDGGAPAIKNGQYLVLEPTGTPFFSDYCLVEMARENKVMLVEFLTEHPDSYSVETVSDRRRITLAKDSVGNISGVVAVVSGRLWRPPQSK